MTGVGVLETVARAELDALLREIARQYRPGALDALTAADPAWRAALDDAEREVGGLFAALCTADETFARWRQAVAELARLWARVGQGAVSTSLEEVA